MSNKKVTLTSSDGETFVFNKDVAFQSQTIKMMVDDDDITIPVGVTGVTLAKVIEYLGMHVDDDKESKDKADNERLRKFDEDFFDLGPGLLCDLLTAANYLNIKGLLELACYAVAHMVKDKTPEQIRQIFNIKNDFTPEEEERVRRENQWAFDQ